MESNQGVINMLTVGVFMTSRDCKDAFFSVPLYHNHQSFWIFLIKVYYKFVCVTNGHGTVSKN